MISSARIRSDCGIMNAFADPLLGLLDPRTDQSEQQASNDHAHREADQGKSQIAQGHSLNGSRFSSPLDHLMTERMLFPSSPVATQYRGRIVPSAGNKPFS